MRNMLTDREYTETVIRSKGIQRAHVVQVLFGGQQALADLLGITRYAINHVMFSRSESERVEQYVLARIPEDRADLRRLWERPWARPKTDRTRREILRIGAILGALGLLK